MIHPSRTAFCTPAAASLLGVSLWTLSLGTTQAATTTFDNGYEDWNFGGYTEIALTGGNPGANALFTAVDAFGADVYNNTNSAFVGNYTTLGGPVILSIDVNVSSITVQGTEVPRNLVVDLRDMSTPTSNGFPYTSVYYVLGTISAADPGWHHFSVTIADPNSTTLPAGWGGFGAEDQYGDPLLPADRTFASVLQHVDDLHFTTFQPGYFYGFTNFDMAYDNLSMTASVPEPSTYALIVVGVGLLGLTALRRQSAVGK